MKIGIVVPHIFMHRDILPHVIFSPATLALNLAAGIKSLGHEVALFTPGPVDTPCRNFTADLSYFEQELAGRDDTYTDLLKKHPLTFITLARQVQSELIAKAYAMANHNELDVVHIYTNEEELGLVFASLCTKPVVFTHHDPFNFFIKYKNLMPKYADKPWISMSYAQRKGMPSSTNWHANIYHGLPTNELQPLKNPTNDYIAYIGRIIEPKGLHLAIDAIKQHNKSTGEKLVLRIAGKHYTGHSKDAYWQDIIAPQIDGETIIYEGFIKDTQQKQQFLGNATAVIVPSIFEEPFGMVLIEALACGTPVIGLDSGAIPEILTENVTGFVVNKHYTPNGQLDEQATVERLAITIPKISKINREMCRQAFLQNFTVERMCAEHLTAYEKITTKLPTAP